MPGPLAIPVGIGSAISGIVGYFGAKTADAVVSKGAAFAFVVASVTALAATLNALVSSIAVPSNPIIIAALGLMPSNFLTCITVAVSARMALFVYTWKSKIVLNTSSSKS